jgi:hypothetical protein
MRNKSITLISGTRYALREGSECSKADKQSKKRAAAPTAPDRNEPPVQEHVSYDGQAGVRETPPPTRGKPSDCRRILWRR